MSATTIGRRADKRHRIMVTPEGLALPITVASRGSRAMALLLDLVIMVVIQVATTLLLATLFTGVLGANEKSPVAEFLAVMWVILMFLFRYGYFLFFELGPRGATPGKRITGIRIAARDCSRLTAEMVIARNLLRDIELFLPLVFLASIGEGGDAALASFAAAAWFLVFALFPCFNKDRLRAGDLIAGSWVVEAPKRKLEAAMSVAKAAGTDSGARPEICFTDEELAVYGEYELQTLERVLRENQRNAYFPVYEAICTKIGRPVEHIEERPFLEAYYRQLRARLEAGMRMGKRKADKFSGPA